MLSISCCINANDRVAAATSNKGGGKLSTSMGLRERGNPGKKGYCSVKLEMIEGGYRWIMMMRMG